MPVLGVDFSQNNAGSLPFAAWYAAGARVAVGRVSIGYRQDAQYPAYLLAARGDGFECRGGYHVLQTWPPYESVRQARLFVDWLAPGLTTFSMLDVEVPGLTESMVRLWCDYYDARCPLPLVLYGNMDLERILGRDNPRYAGYGLLAADYGPGTITSVPLRAPHVPAVGHMIGHQFAGNNGRLPPYTHAVDLSMWGELPDGTMAKMKPGTLYGIHAESSSQAIPLIRRAQEAGAQFSAVLAMENPGLCTDAKKIDPNILTIARWANPVSRWEGAQEVFSWSDAERLDFARKSIQLVFDRTNDEEYQACDFFCPGMNEADPPEANGDGYRALAMAMKALCQEATNRSPEMTARGLHPIRLAIPGFNAGTPEWNEMQAMIATGLFDLMKARGDILIMHEGVGFDQPIDAGFGDLIPGAPSVPPNAGSLCGRFNYLYSLGVQVPFVVTEWYDGNRRETDPATRLAAIKWYDRLVRRNPWCRGFCPFELTDDPNSTWRGVDFTPTFQSDAMLADMVAEKDKPNPTENNDMPNISDTDYAGLVAANAAVTAILNKYTVPWWLVPAVPFVVVARSLPLNTYNLDHTVHDVRPYASYDLNVTARTADGWLMVAPALLVRAADVKLKGA